MKQICIIKTGSTFGTTRSAYNDFEDWIVAKLELPQSRPFTVNVQGGDALPDLEQCDGVIVTGSHSMVTDDEAWSRQTAAWLAEAVARGIPMLAICYGHQLLAKALGGVSGYHRSGMEIGTVAVELTDSARDDRLFCELPQRFDAHTIHSQTVVTLPEGAVRLAFNAHDENHAFRMGPSAWGVQFHPEFDRAVMRSYIDEVSKSEPLGEEKRAALLEAARETAEATAILKRFEKLVCEG
ncbi:glutamine amidotransferase [Sulfurimonas sp. HSL-1656]|uniref:glutamine amidotransferase n=1 Tax=Thiomicrolovo subterrani TaxID=3131934 RepID=UPI0031F857DC